MRRDRFEQIRGMMRFTDPLNVSSGSLHKISFLLNHLNDKFSSNYIPGEYIAVDEFLSKWKGRLHFRQFIPSKRERYSVKIYVCCESNTGYLWRFIIYTGADTIYIPKPFGDYTGPSKVVLPLIDGMYNQGYKVVLDDLYTSPELLRALIENGTDSFATLRRKQGLSSGFWEWKPPKSYLSSLPPISEFCGDIMACRWNDCYTKHIGELVGDGKIHYSSKKEIVKPDVIIEYNSSMGGVDNLSRVLDPYCCQRKSLKWYRKIAELFLDVSIYNSFVVWRELNDSKDTHLNSGIDLKLTNSH